jgi:hypothetical protein
MPTLQTAVIVPMPLYETELAYAALGFYSEGEIMGLDAEGHVLSWDCARRAPRVLDVSVDEILASLDPACFLETDRIERDMAALGMVIAASASPHV